MILLSFLKQTPMSALFAFVKEDHPPLPDNISTVRNTIIVEHTHHLCFVLSSFFACISVILNSFVCLYNLLIGAERLALEVFHQEAKPTSWCQGPLSTSFLCQEYSRFGGRTYSQLLLCILSLDVHFSLCFRALCDDLAASALANVYSCNIVFAMTEYLGHRDGQPHQRHDTLSIPDSVPESQRQPEPELRQHTGWLECRKGGVSTQRR